MTMSNSLFSGLASVILVIALLGIAVGVAVSNTDLLNFNRSAAEVEILKQTAQVQAQRDAIDMDNYQRIKAAKTEAELARLELEQEALRKERAYALTARQRLDQVWLIVGPLAVLILVFALTLFLMQYGRSQLLMAQARSTQVKMIQAARVNELTWRAANIASAGKVPAQDGNGHHPVKEPPWRGGTMRQM